jgi:hypothetical protein
MWKMNTTVLKDVIKRTNNEWHFRFWKLNFNLLLNRCNVITWGCEIILKKTKDNTTYLNVDNMFYHILSL